jgi:hypothetical protein
MNQYTEELEKARKNITLASYWAAYGASASDCARASYWASYRTSAWSAALGSSSYLESAAELEYQIELTLAQL